MPKEGTTRTRRDRWADWLVVGLLALALLLGWAVMAYAQGQREIYTDDEAGLTVRYPQDWLLKADKKLAFQALDPGSGGYKTTYQVRLSPVAASSEVTQTLAVVLNDASLARAQGATAFRLFDVEEGKPIADQPSMEASYVLVAESADLFSQRMPVVVQGLDIAVGRGETAYVFSLLAADDAFEAAVPGFRRFVASAEIK